MIPVLGAADFSESELLEVWEDPNAETRMYALGFLGRVRGDDERVFAILRSELVKAIDANDHVRQEVCVDALVRRFVMESLPDLRKLWESKIKRDVRTRVLSAFGALGVTDYYEHAYALFRRGLRNNHRYSGDIYIMVLATYLFRCAAHGVGDSLDVKTLIRERLIQDKLKAAEWRPPKDSPAGRLYEQLIRDNPSGLTRWPTSKAMEYEQMMPGISDESVPLSEVPDPTFHPISDTR